MLIEARELLEKYGEEIDEECFTLNGDIYTDLKYFPHTKDWSIGMLISETQINLPQLEEILKNQ
jgi:hypothetical protein